MRFAKALYPSVHAFFRDLTATVAGSIAGSAFLRLPPATGRSAFSGELFLDRQKLPDHVAARMGKAGDDLGAHRIGHAKDYRDLQCRAFGGKRDRDAARN